MIDGTANFRKFTDEMAYIIAIGRAIPFLGKRTLSFLIRTTVKKYRMRWDFLRGNVKICKESTPKKKKRFRIL